MAFLWHMHQPWYILPSTGEALLPWVRLRAVKDYYDMGRIITGCEARATVNFSPALTEQLSRYAAGALTDPYQDLYLPGGEEPPGLDSISLPLEHRGFTPASAERTLQLIKDPAERGGLDRRVWFNLAWTSQVALEEDLALRAIWAKGKGFSPVELAHLRQRHEEILSELLPLYRRLAEDGQIELSATPFYHPILPLLINTGIARRAQPHDSLPGLAFPKDAWAQVERAIAHHAEMFGRRPMGMWPAEGAVSPEAMALFAKAGLTWIATDGEILARTLGHPPTPAEIYRPWRLPTENGEIIVVFRDSVLSNLISFDYYAWESEKAVADLLGRLQAVGKAWHEDAPPLVLVAMDGENAWDHYERNGRPFLEGIYRGIAADSTLRMMPIGEYIERFGAGGSLKTIWSGSWIDASFKTWIGSPSTNRAWEALWAAHVAVEECPDDGRKERAREHIYVAEGSDWFWWYSPYHSSPQEAEFDRLFREQLAWAYREIGREPPEGMKGGVAI